ncbi:MAG: NAD(P)H-binding protein [Alphaproteobacteria bacterium]|nr:NAD(P)H-binding protein [Alphaproteobacteria bacterium]
MAKFIVTGATGFIGRHVVAALLERRHTVIGVHRGPVPPSLSDSTRFESVEADLTKMKSVEDWTPLLDGADAVINCDDSLTTPPALFKSCRKTGVTRLIQVSNMQRDDDALMKTDLDWVIVRPSLVYARGFFGGTSSLHSEAAFPGSILLSGDGRQRFQPIYIGDVVGIICELCEASSFSRKVIEPVGPETLTLKEILLKLRRWLDIPGQTTLSLPGWLLSILGIDQIHAEDTATTHPFTGLYAPAARSMNDVLVARASNTGDRRTARLALLAPVLTGALFLTWVILGLLEPVFNDVQMRSLLSIIGLESVDPKIGTWITSGWALAIGLLVTTTWRTVMLAVLQVLTVIGYVGALSVIESQTGLESIGPLLKSGPFILLIGVWATLRDQR